MEALKNFGINFQERVKNAILKLKEGKGIILVGPKNKEYEGVIFYPAETIKVKDMDFILKNGSGNICLCLGPEKSNEQGLNQLLTNILPEDKETCIKSLLYNNKEDSAVDKIQTILAVLSRNTDPDNQFLPGHVFPLFAKTNGVIEYKGFAEGSIDLICLSDSGSAVVLSELQKVEGTLLNLPEMLSFAENYGLSVVSIDDVYNYRYLNNINALKQGETANLPTAYGYFKTVPFLQFYNHLEHIVIIKGTWNPSDSVLVRIHSSCTTGDIFASFRCDCGSQLHEAMRMIEREGQGVIVYLNQEGRGIGLCNKIHAYKLQDEGMDTVEANLALGFEADERDYGIGACILKELGIHHLRLITNNPSKSKALQNYGFNIKDIIPLEIEPNPFNSHYLNTKKEKMGHLLNKPGYH